MKTFNNAQATKDSKNSNNHNWEGDYRTAESAREKCLNLENENKKSFYKKTGENYTVYSFK